MKTAISIPNNVFEQAEQVARRLKVSRSELYTKAVEQYLEQFQEEDITARLNEVYSRNDSSLDPALMRAQLAILDREEW